jgi:hypothetical protein
VNAATNALSQGSRGTVSFDLALERTLTITLLVTVEGPVKHKLAASISAHAGVIHGERCGGSDLEVTAPQVLRLQMTCPANWTR